MGSRGQKPAVRQAAPAWEVKMLTGEFKTLTEQIEMLTEESKTLTEQIEMLTEESRKAV